MLEMKIPVEIQEYKSKLIFGFSTRQIISIIVAIGICVPFVSVGKNYLSESLLSWITIIIALLCFCWGFVRIQDMPFEEVVKVFINHNINEQKRVYEDTELNFFIKINEKITENEIVQQQIDEGWLEVLSDDEADESYQYWN